MKREISISALFGIVAGLLFVLTAIALDVVGLKFDVWLPIVLSLVVSAALIYVLKDAGKKNFGVDVALFIISSAYSLSFFCDLSLIGPTPEQQAHMHLLSRIRDDSRKIDPNWKDSTLNFLSPKCYSASVAKKYDNTSLEIAVFSYRISKSLYDPNRFVKVFFMKFFCGYADSKTAYEIYKKTLVKNGFELKEDNSSFIAENESFAVFCSRENKLITVIKVERGKTSLIKELGLLNSSRLKEIRGYQLSTSSPLTRE